MRTRTMSMMALAGAMLVGMTAGASAQRMERDAGMMMMDSAEVRTQRMERMDTMEGRTMREPRTTRTVTTTRPGASMYAPGQMKKRTTVKTTNSARQFSPGAGTGRPPGQMMMQEESGSRVRVR